MGKRRRGESKEKGTCESAWKYQRDFVQDGREKDRDERFLPILPSSAVVLGAVGLPPCISQPGSWTSVRPAVLMGLPAEHCRALGGVPGVPGGKPWCC